MREAKVIELPEIGEITVRELTVGQLDTLLADGGETTTLDFLYSGDNLSTEIIITATGLKYEQLKPLAPSELQPLILAVKEANPVFFAAARKLKRLQENLASAAKNSGTTSEPTP